MKLTKRKDTKKSRKYWKFVEKVAREVNKWPAWKTGDEKKKCQKQ